MFKGILLLKVGDLNASEQYLQRALTIDPSLPSANYYLSLVHYQMKDYATAESDLFYERDINPDNEVCLLQLGIYLDIHVALSMNI